MSEYDVHKAAASLMVLELETNEIVEVEDPWTGGTKEESTLVYAGAAHSTIVSALDVAYEAGAEHTKKRAESLLRKLSARYEDAGEVGEHVAVDNAADDIRDMPLTDQEDA